MNLSIRFTEREVPKQMRRKTNYTILHFSIWNLNRGEFKKKWCIVFQCEIIIMVISPILELLQ